MKRGKVIDPNNTGNKLVTLKQKHTGKVIKIAFLSLIGLSLFFGYNQTALIIAALFFHKSK